jgi:hypothetical protein
MDWPDRSEFWNPTTLRYQFQAEAKRLWEIEMVSPVKITTIQAGAIICLCCNENALDKLGSMYLAQSIVMGKAIGLFSLHDGFDDERHAAVNAATAWGLWGWQA